jgi:hypothetical protein
MVKQKTDMSIEEVNREKLFKYIETKEFLAVVFCKFIFIMKLYVELLLITVHAVGTRKKRSEMFICNLF